MGIARIKRSAFILSLAAATALSSQAMAAAASDAKQDVYFYPAKGWSVSAQAGSKGASCVIQSEFNNGFIISFAGSGASPSALNIDFRQGVFKAGQSYDVKVGVPGGASRQLSARAVSNGALSVNFQGQDDIYGAMQQSSVFDFSVAGNDFRFYLSGFAPAVKSFEQCQSGGGAPAAAPIAAPSPAAPEQNPGKQAQAEIPPAPSSAPSSAPVAAAGSPEEKVNESIALEQKEQQRLSGVTPPPGPIATIDTTNADAPVIAAVPVTQKNMIGAKEVTPAQEQAINTSPAAHKRMSEELAEEMAKNPALASDQAQTGEEKPIPSSAPPGKLSLSEASAAAPQPDAPSSMPPSMPEPQAGDAKPLPAPAPDDAMMTPAPPAAAAPNDASVNAMPLPAPSPATQSPATKVSAPAGAKPAAAPATQTASIQGEASETQTTETIHFNQPRATPAAAPPVNGAPVVKHETEISPDAIVHRDTTIMRADLTKEGINPQDVEPAAASSGAEASSPPGGTRKADPELLQKISDLEQAVADLKRENMALNSDLKTNLKDATAEDVSISSQNWNLEKATMAYNESEREVKRLGQQVQEDRAQCAAQKQDIEAQLFDPEVTSQQQLAHLADLEQKLTAAQEQLDAQRIHYEARIKALEVSTSASAIKAQ